MKEAELAATAVKFAVSVENGEAILDPILPEVALTISVPACTVSTVGDVRVTTEVALFATRL